MKCLSLHGLYNAVRRGTYNRFFIHFQGLEIEIQRDKIAPKLYQLILKHGMNHKVVVEVNENRDLIIRDLNVETESA